MIVTEETATTSIKCPYGVSSKTNLTCDGSKCMAWDWFDDVIFRRHNDREIWRGYCNRGGRPE